ncbi:unnamed protein product (macronuclear) [Paramecium tetraurelia]|uniref:Cilia- and flagella-associated protein 157 n=2 Tax=Paramecium TaxID=5884 RepID=A0CXD2_PARTE|nr:uncharacterized protein GSPATT00011081001 [Paramecium tetraurelia]CAD8155425.1 unnamed protein product [Paramecium octaurelia]CAK75449.1 unnamed protein product [Paramecium tetraurelia]|eukprot:XP_001442846.1 hypothetical protein (macronuclear) [Paramecium tetraurelia strain d4-2]
MAKKKQQIEVVEFTEAEKKALEKLDHSHLLIEIQVLQDRIEELQKKIYELNENIRKSNEQNLALTLKMESDIIKKESEYNALLQQYEDLKKQTTEEIESMIQRKDEKIRYLEKEKTELEIRHKDELQKINEELKKWSQFKEEKENLIKEIHDLKEEMIKKDYAHLDEQSKANKNFLKQTQNLTNVNNAKIEDVQRNANKLAEEKVAAKYDGILKENEKIKSELLEYQRTLQVYQKDKETFQQENVNYKLNLSIKEEQAQEYQMMNHQQTIKIKQLKERIEYLKSYIANEVTKQTKEIEIMKHQSNTKVQELEMQLRNLRHLLDQRTKELKTVKALAQMILDQRSDIEQFFLQAIDQVKNEIKKKNKNQKNSRLPDISQKSQSLEQNKVDINDLDLEEKEKLLRILFSKMNQGVPPINWKSQLSHSKSQVDASSFRDNQYQ